MSDFSIFSPDGVNTLNVKDAPARNMVTDAFSASTAYAVGDYCIYNGVLYRCSTAHEGAWASGDFAATTIAEELKNAGGGGDSENPHWIIKVTPDDANGTTWTHTYPAGGNRGCIFGEIRVVNEENYYSGWNYACSAFYSNNVNTKFYGSTSNYPLSINAINLNIDPGGQDNIIVYLKSYVYLTITRYRNTFTATLSSTSKPPYATIDLYAICP